VPRRPGCRAEPEFVDNDQVKAQQARRDPPGVTLRLLLLQCVGQIHTCSFGRQIQSQISLSHSPIVAVVGLSGNSIVHD
jgi:hypothetical protein